MRIAVPYAAIAIGALLSGCAANVVASAPHPAVAVAATQAPTAPPDTMRWLYGSGEGAAASIQAFRALADYVVPLASAKDAASRMSVPMGLNGSSPSSVACGTRPAAVVFDIDETLLLNLGYEYWQAKTGSSYDAGVWDEWERNGVDYVAPVPGAVTALKRLRAAGVTVVFNSNRSAANADATIAAIRAAGLGDAVHGETLFLKSDDAQGSAKDGRRATIAGKYCVVALAGDNLGDFSDMLNDKGRDPAARRELVAHGPVAQLWGHGWFLLPNPVYGAGIAGDLDQIFPAAARWLPQQDK